MADSFEFEILNAREHTPYKKIIIKRKKASRFWEPDVYSFESSLSTWNKQEKVSINRVVVDENNTNIKYINTGYPIYTFRKSGVYTSVANSYEKSEWVDVDVVFHLTDGRRIRANITEVEQINGLLPLLFDDKHSRVDTLICSKCNSLMIRRVAETGKNTGNEFYGCTRYPDCRNTVGIKVQSKANTPTCSACGAPMAKRIAKTGVNAGNEFYGCTRYPDCRNTMSIS